MYLVSCLRGHGGQAQAVLGDLDMISRYNFTALTTALNRRFVLKTKRNLTERFWKIECVKRQKAYQSYRKSCAGWQEMHTLEIQDSLAKDQFLDALNDANLLWQIFQALPKTLDEALEIAVESEAFKIAESQLLLPRVRQIYDDVGRVENASDNSNDRNHAELLKPLVEKFGPQGHHGWIWASTQKTERNKSLLQLWKNMAHTSVLSWTQGSVDIWGYKCYQ